VENYYTVRLRYSTTKTRRILLMLSMVG